MADDANCATFFVFTNKETCWYAFNTTDWSLIKSGVCNAICFTEKNAHRVHYKPFTKGISGLHYPYGAARWNPNFIGLWSQSESENFLGLANCFSINCVCSGERASDAGPHALALRSLAKVLRGSTAVVNQRWRRQCSWWMRLQSTASFRWTRVGNSPN